MLGNYTFQGGPYVYKASKMLECNLTVILKWERIKPFVYV